MHRTDRGQATVEFAMVITLIVLLMIGVFDMGRVVFAYNGVSHAARDATRRGSVDPSNCEAIFVRVQRATSGQQDVVVRVDYQAASASGSASDICDTYDPDGTYADPASGAMDAGISPQVGGSLTVVVTQQANLVTPIVATLVGDSLSVSADSTMTITSYRP